MAYLMNMERILKLKKLLTCWQKLDAVPNNIMIIIYLDWAISCPNIFFEGD